jgi:hydroxypyruvate isomerase
MATFATALDWVVAVGGTAVHCVAGVAAEVTTRHRDTLVANLAAAADRAAPHGIAILVEMINQRDRPGFVIRSIEEAAAIVRDTGHAGVRVMFDTYHVQIMQGDVVRRLARHLDVIGHVQVAAVPDRGEPDAGELDHAFVLAELDRLGYAGWVGAEYRPRSGSTTAGLGWRDRLAARGVAWR